LLFKAKIIAAFYVLCSCIFFEVDLLSITHIDFFQPTNNELIISNALSADVFTAELLSVYIG